MSLFVVVLRNKRTGQEYLYPKENEGYTEYSDAKRDRDLEQEAGDGANGFFDVYVGKVVPAEEET